MQLTARIEKLEQRMRPYLPESGPLLSDEERRHVDGVLETMAANPAFADEYRRLMAVLEPDRDDGT